MREDITSGFAFWTELVCSRESKNCFTKPCIWKTNVSQTLENNKCRFYSMLPLQNLPSFTCIKRETEWRKDIFASFFFGSTEEIVWDSHLGSTPPPLAKAFWDQMVLPFSFVLSLQFVVMTAGCQHVHSIRILSLSIICNSSWQIVSFVHVFKCWCLCCAPAGPNVNHGGWQAEALLAAGAW